MNRVVVVPHKQVSALSLEKEVLAKIESEIKKRRLRIAGGGIICMHKSLAEALQLTSTHDHSVGDRYAILYKRLLEGVVYSCEHEADEWLCGGVATVYPAGALRSAFSLNSRGDILCTEL